MVAPIGIIVLLPVLLIFVSLIILAIIKGGVAGKVFVGVFFALLGFVFLGLVTMRARPVRVEQIGHFPPNVAVPYTTTSGGGIAWRDGVEDEMKADVYSSKAAAVRGLARELEVVIAAIAANQADPLAIRILEGEVDDHLLGELKAVLSESFPDVVTIGGEGEFGLKISLAYADTQENNVWRNEIQQGNTTLMRHTVGVYLQSGLITATVETAEGKEIASVKYSEKQWLDDTQGFMQSTRSNHWAVARSNEACLSEEEAMNQAMGKACLLIASRTEYDGQYI